MSLPTRQLLLLLASITLPSSAAICHACVCVQSKGPPCGAYNKADAVFVGSVSHITELPGDDGSNFAFRKRLMRFAVDKPYYGVETSEVELLSTLSSCGYNFEQGKRYLVYAYRRGKAAELETSVCTRTRLASEAGEDIVYLQNLSDSVPEHVIRGSVRSERATPLRRITISVSGGGKNYRALTDGEGRFSVAVDGAGKYKVYAISPEGSIIYSRQHRPTEVRVRGRTVLEYEVALGRGCVYLEFHALVKGVAGRPKR